MAIRDLSTPVPAIIQVLAHEVRWQLVRALIHSDYRVRELVELTKRPLNLISYHLKQLREESLVTERRSSADARDVYYHLDLHRLHTLYMSSGADIHPALGQPHPELEAKSEEGHSPKRILFVCTHNSARSQMAEAITRKYGGSRVEVFSAGSEPSSIHPDAIAIMAMQGIDMSSHASKHMEAFYDQHFDYVITVCDRARETCPVFPNDPERIHWSFPDPGAISNPTERLKRFESIARELVQRINYLLIIANRKQ